METQPLAHTDSFFAPRDFVDQFDLSAGEYIADFGSGSGEFAVEMARRIGPEGRVFAFDIRPAALQVLQSKSKSQGLNNIRPIRADLEKEHSTGVSERKMDMVLIHNVIFQVKDKAAVLSEARRILKENGRVVAVEWQKDSPLGPPKNTRLDKGELRVLFEKHGFSFHKELKAGRYHYALAFTVEV